MEALRGEEGTIEGGRFIIYILFLELHVKFDIWICDVQKFDI